jgi:hypothetical protein
MKENNFKVGDKIQYTPTKGERKTITGRIYKIFSTVFGSCQQGTGLQVDWDNPTKTRRRTTVNAKHCVKLGQNGLGRVGRELSKSIKTIKEADKHMGKALQKLKDVTIDASMAVIPGEARDVEEKEEQFTWTTKPNAVVKPKIIIEPITMMFSPSLSEDKAVIAEIKALSLFFDDRAKKEGKMKEVPHTPKDVLKKLLSFYKEHSVPYGRVRTDFFPRRNIAKEDIDNEIQV